MNTEPEERKWTVGEQLRAERAKKKLSLDEVAFKTKISKRLIKAIEESRFEELASPVSLKGFLRIYCEFLGLDFEPMLKELKEADVLKKDQNLKLTHSLDNSDAVVTNQASMKYWAIGASVMAGILVIYFIASLVLGGRAPEKPVARRIVLPAVTLEATASPEAHPFRANP